MLKSYEALLDHGQIHWLESPPDLEGARVIVTVLPATPAPSVTTMPPRRPPARLKGTARSLGDLVAPLFTDEECEAMLERTARQIAGDPEAFK
jgi:hypothetical protein